MLLDMQKNKIPEKEHLSRVYFNFEDVYLVYEWIILLTFVLIQGIYLSF